MTAYRAADGSLTTLLYDELGMLAALQRSGQLYFVAVDPVGSPRVVTDATGAIIRTAEYDAFGRPGAVTGSFELAVGFAGGLADPVTGLVRFGLRDYDPVTGRWTARDPIFLSGKQFNLYQYVAGNPVSLRDPSGLFCVGASGFSVVGGGGKLCLNKDGFSACGELGVGVGGSTDLNPWGGLDNTFQGLNVAATAKAGPLASLSAEADIGNYGDPYEGGSQLCTRANFQLKGSIGPIEMSSANLGDPKFDFNTYGELKDAYEAGSLDAKAALEAKATYKVCGQRGWGNLF
jgi:RHS repeat-associated protein